MMNFGPTFLWTAVNLLILYLLMRALLFKPVTRFMEKRSQSIRDAIESAERNRAESAALKIEYETLLKNAAAEGGRIVEAARVKAEKEQDSILAAAKESADKLLEKAREEIEHERTEAFKALKNQTVELALLAASRVMEKNMDNDANRVLVDKFIDEVGAA